MNKKSGIVALKRHFLHLNEEEFEGYILESLDSETNHSVEAHLHYCLSCRNEVKHVQKAICDFEQGRWERSDELAHSTEIEHSKWGRGARFWLGEKFYPIKVVKADPTIAEVRGLTINQLLDSRDADLQEPGACFVGIESETMATIAPLSKFAEVQAKAMGATAREEGYELPTGGCCATGASSSIESRSLVRILQYNSGGLILEVLTNTSGAVFLSTALPAAPT
jgi:hypothetical protein